WTAISRPCMGLQRWRSATTPGSCPTMPMVWASWGAAAARISSAGRRPMFRCRWARSPRRSVPTAAIFVPPPRGVAALLHAPPPGVVALIRTRARTVIYSPGLPPAVVAAAIAALDVIERDPAYAALPLAKTKAFARGAGLPEPVSPIVPVLLGEAEAALKASRLLED